MSREFLEYVTPWLVDHPDEVMITEADGERDEIVYELAVHPDDMGKIIGKRGRIIRSLRALARAAGGRDARAVSVEVVD
ncbi:MAG TPA: KH domain-containing protein [Actinomycetota bacterium]|nr:KH domain-containing protein [Actinomycetota bacterium]